MTQSKQSTSSLHFSPPRGNVRLDDFDPLQELQSLRRKWESQSSSLLSSTPSVTEQSAPQSEPKRESVPILTASPAPVATVIPPILEDTSPMVHTLDDTTSSSTDDVPSYVVAELSGWLFLAIGMCFAMVGSLFFLRHSLFPELPRWEMDLPLVLLGSLVCSLGLGILLWRLRQILVRMSKCKNGNPVSTKRG